MLQGSSMMLDKKILNFISKLGLDKKNFYTIDKLHLSSLNKDLIARLIKLNVDAVYLFADNPTLLFKFSQNYDEQDIQNTLMKSWNFDKAPILFYVTDTDIVIYNTFIFPKEGKLQRNILGNENELSQFHINKLTDETFWENQKAIFQNKNRINKHLLQNIIDAKKVLIQQKLEEEYIHNIIGRSLFLRYVIDRGIISLRLFGDYNCVEDIFLSKTDLYSAFEKIKVYFNGDLFPLSDNEYVSIEDIHLATLHMLFSGGEISSGQQSLFSYYDFSIIPVELISNIYERFLHDGNNSAQSHYTPSATVDLVFEQLLGTSKLQQNKIKILDPSCGSGVFLVTFLKKYFERDLTHLTPEIIFDFIESSLFGIDIDEDAIKITIFSIYITVLEFFDKTFIQEHDFLFPNLLEKNFFVGDFFDTEASYNKDLDTFDFIVGNPPWGKVKESLHLYMSYCEINSFEISDKQIAQAFMYRVNDFMERDTLTALVIPSKIFYNTDASSFRDNFLSLFDIKAIIEMSLERKKTFNKAIHPSAIMFYTKQQDENNIFTHLTLNPSIFYDLFKMFIFSEENLKTVSQKDIMSKHWMWKPLLYGSQLDIDFIKRLKRKFSTLKEFINDEGTSIGAGCIYMENKGERPLPKNIYSNYKLLLTNRHENSFYLNNVNLDSCEPIHNVYKKNKFYDKGSINNYKGPHLLIKRGVSSNGLVVGVTEEDCIFRNSVYGIHHEDKNYLYFLASLYNSNIYKYFSFMTSASWGVERPEVLMAEHRQLPIPLNINPSTIYKLSHLYTLLQDLTVVGENIGGLFSNNEKKIQQCYKKINKIVNNEIFNLSELEIDLIDYGIKTYPQISENIANNYKVDKKIIKEYCSMFTHEISILNEKKKNIYTPYISINEQFIFMYFKANDTKNKELTWLKYFDADIKNILEASFDLSIESMTNDVAFKRKIFGMDGDNFYFIKPNQTGIFHTLNARLDAKSFVKYWITK